MTKWGDRPHWAYDGVYLGADEHGEWVGFPAGTRYRRPGMDFVGRHDGVMLVPADGAPYLAAFNGPEATAKMYVDITTVPAWEGSVVRAVDLDLDVVVLQDGTTFLDDEDEFVEHQSAFGYPPDVVAMAERTAQEVLAAATARRAPYDGTAERWLAGLRRP